MQTQAAIKAGLVTRLETISGLHVKAGWPNTIILPQAIILTRVSPRRTAGGDREILVMITMLVQLADVEHATTNIDLYTDATGTKSIIAALEGDQTLGGIADFIYSDDDGYGWMDFPEIREIPPNSQNYCVGQDFLGSVWVAA